MPKAEVTLSFAVPEDRIQEFVTAVRKLSEDLADTWRCRDVHPEEGLRCELSPEHVGSSPKNHHHGYFSWPVAQDN